MDLPTLRRLADEGRHEVARLLAVQLAAAAPHDAQLQHEAACLHDRMGLEAEALPYYCAALAAGLPAPEDRRARLGLGSTYRVLGRAHEALEVLDGACARYPQAPELQVFRAMALQNLGRGKEAVEVLLRVVAETSGDEQVRQYRRAIALYADDVERTWP